MTRKGWEWMVAFGLLPALLLLSTCRGPAGTETRNRDVVAEMFESVNRNDLAALDALIRTDYVRHCQATPDLVVDSLTAFKEFLEADKRTFPDRKIEVVRLVAEGDYVAFLAVYHGTQRGPLGDFQPTDRAMRLDMSGLHRLKEGKIAETWVTWDNMAAFRQLGLFKKPLPPDAPGAAATN